MPSSVIRDRVYDADTARLTITFVTGRIYVYEDVPPDVAGDFDAASSKGQFFNAHIRDRFRCREITTTQSSAYKHLDFPSLLREAFEKRSAKKRGTGKHRQ